VDIDLDAWRELVEQAEPGLPLSAALAQLRVFSGEGSWPQFVGVKLRDLDIREAELDGAAPTERVIFAQFRSEREPLFHAQTNHAIMRVLVASGERWCLSRGGEVAELAFAPMADLPNSGHARFRLVELLEPGVHALELRAADTQSLDQDKHPGPRYMTSYYVWEAAGLRRIFGPDWTYWRRQRGETLDFGAIELRGRLPKRIHTTHWYDCDADDRELPPSNCRTQAQARFEFVDGKYREQP
jgi:hypothetical protein